MNLASTVLLLLLLQSVVLGCTPAKQDTFTLYRNSSLDSTMRIHIATFDSKENGATYNQEECMHAAELYQKQPGVAVKFWCEKGSYKK